MSNERVKPLSRERFCYFDRVTTRWNDNDIYGHLNNVVHYTLFDSAVNRWLAEVVGCRPLSDETIGLVVNTGCDYFAELAYPDVLEVGISTVRIGSSSVTYRLGLFREGAEFCAALGSFTHVYVDRQSRRPVSLPAAMRGYLTEISDD